MSLETALYLSQLNVANPTPADPKSQGDDHIRTTKVAAKNSFPGFPGTVMLGGVDTGATNAYVLTPTTPLLAYSASMVVVWLPANTNGGASTINVSALGAQAIKRLDGTALTNGDILAGVPVAMLYTGTEFRLLGVTKQYIDQLVYSGVLPGQAGNAGKVLITDGTTAAFSNAFGVAMDEAQSLDVASASTLDLRSSASVTGNLVYITGSAAITTITLPAGAERVLVFTGAATLTHGANLIVPGSASVTAAAGDVAVVRGVAGGIARVISYVRRTGRAVVEQLPPGWVLLAPPLVPTNGVAAIDFLNIFSSTYDDYVVLCDGMTCTSRPAIQLARGGVVDGAAHYFSGEVNESGSDLATYFETLLSSSGPSVCLEIVLTNIGASAMGSWHGIFTRGAGYTIDRPGGSAYATAVNGGHMNTDVAASISGFRLLAPGGTFGGTGAIKIYGIRKA